MALDDGLAGGTPTTASAKYRPPDSRTLSRRSSIASPRPLMAASACARASAGAVSISTRAFS